MRVAVVGGGLAGLASAVFLARAGRDVTIFEAMPRIAPEGTGILLQPAGLEVLERMDLAAAALAHGCAIERIVTRTRDGQQLMDLPYAELRPQLHALGIRRPMLAALLREAARTAGVDLRFDAGVARLDHRPAATWLELRSGGDKQGPFDLVLLCDGMYSRLRAAETRARVSVHPLGVYSLVAPMPKGLPTQALTQCVDGTRDAVGLLPIGRATGGVPLVSFFWDVRTRERMALETRGFEAWCRDIEGFSPEAGELLRAAGDFPALTFFTTAQVNLRRWFRGRTLIMGDAAHALDPHLGLGATLALLDAECLEDCLREAGDDVATALTNYQARRRRAVAPYSRISRLWSGLDAAGLSPVRRRLFLAVANRSPRVRRQLLSRVCGYGALRT
jgi:2-polyprenyl-6-methoxyphenol hydroxylase-like FAD-dependent oxidoreductase